MLGSFVSPELRGHSSAVDHSVDEYTAEKVVDWEAMIRYFSLKNQSFLLQSR